MRLLVLAVGRMKQGPERDLLRRYDDRIRAGVRSVGLTGFEIHEIDESRARQAEDRKAQEARALAEHLPAGALAAVLDERGQSMSSEAFTECIAKARDRGVPAFALMIGGPDGTDEALRASAGHRIAYGAATFPHQIVRVLAVEQVYRAITILSGHPYHRV